MGNHQFAVNDFNKAISMNSEKSEAYYYRGISKMKSKLLFEALDDFTKYISPSNFTLEARLSCKKEKRIPIQAFSMAKVAVS